MAYDQDRRQFLLSAGLGLTAAPLFAQAALSAEKTAGPDGTLNALIAGNRRFVAGEAQCRPATARRAELAAKQAPSATVLGCSDSRVPVEIVFDREPGDIFVVRVAGNFVDDGGLGSIEYAVAVLKSHLLMVLGHSSCGAVSAAVKYVEDGSTVPGHMMAFVHAIEPAAKAAKSQPGDWVSNAIAQNVRANVKALTDRSSILAKAVAAKELTIVGAVYDLHTGTVTPLD